MIVKLTENIWWGDKPSVTESLGQVQSIINVAHAIRRPYWQDLGKLDWRVWYFRLASPDREPLDDDYVQALQNIVLAISLAGKYPLLCHCRAGGHRGPTAAFFAASITATGTAEHTRLIERMRELKPDFFKRHKHRVYRSSILDRLGLMED